jgi:hypothetical protein
MTLQRNEFFEALSAAFELKPQANVTFPQGHMEIYEIKSDRPAKQILELISLNNGAVIMTGVLELHVPAPAGSTRVDTQVRTFRALDADTSYVLATDGKLWREFNVWNNERSPRVRVDSSVKAFQTLDSSTIYVLGHEASCGANSAAPIMTNGRALRLTPMSRRSTQTLSTCLGLMETFGEKRGPCKSGPGSQRTSTHSRLSMTIRCAVSRRHPVPHPTSA